LKRIVLINDDGPDSKGLVELAKQLAPISDLTVIVPEGQRSATGKSITIGKPLRIHEHMRKGDFDLITHDGTPADSAIIAKTRLENIDLFLSGINTGANIGYDCMYTSGTVGAIMQAGILGYPGIAISKVTESKGWFDNSGVDFGIAREVQISCDIIESVLKNGLPPNVDAVNLNFPVITEKDSQLVVTRPTRMRILNSLEERLDPFGNPYYWLRVDENEYPKGTDADEVLNKGNISISPILLESVGSSDLQAMRDFMGL
jgi:5'-nucleotidase